MSTNRLRDEKSPYLKQHENNPVNWYPWIEEAFEKAEKEDKPIFLSIGYSTCHWCHRMAEESFENEEIADILNKYFISIKVDREERYDIDNIYMKFCQAMTGKGGWPMSIFMTPDKKPFYTGTYFPRVDFRGITGFKSILNSINRLWKEDKEKLLNSSEEILKFVKENYLNSNSLELEEYSIIESVERMSQIFDSEYGGFGEKPKFPMGHNISFLIEYYNKFNDTRALKIAEKTLDSIFKGGIYDHIGGGFSRYSVDNRWIIPHFEKMLYDNALLIEAYSRAYEINRNPIYKKIVYDTIDFLKREMKSDEGGFFAGIDADSEGDEGKFYLWNRSELELILGKDNFNKLRDYFNMEKSMELKNRVVLNRVGKDIDIEDYNFIDRELKILFKHRENRIKPKVDSKIICSWNSILAKSLFVASRIFEDEELANIGEDILEFIRKNLIKDGRIMTAYIEGEVKYKGYIQDYSCFIDALLEKYHNNKNEDLLGEIELYIKRMKELFEDENGGFFLVGEDAEIVLLRAKETTDGAIASGNSIAIKSIIKLAKILDDEKMKENMKRALDSNGKDIRDLGIYHSEGLRALLEYYK
ncbi:MAG: thioredoxin domain-containing protein [Andreesenia angusta]|nr:thioredoxin domain-containing protein [Andreesenia angusta]